MRPALDDHQLRSGSDSAARWPLTSSGTIASESPWMTSVGTVTFSMSPRKSVRPNASMQSSVPFGEANEPIVFM